MSPAAWASAWSCDCTEDFETDLATETQSPDVAAAAPSFEAIYADELRYVWNTLRRLGVEARHIEDVAHDVFVVVHRRLCDFDPTRALRPWLFGISFRVASDHRRRASTQRELYDPEVERVDSSPDAEALTEASRSRALVVEALQDLEPDLRAVLTIVDIDDCSAPEAADALEIPVNTVYSRLRRARARFGTAVRRRQQKKGGSA